MHSHRKTILALVLIVIIGALSIAFGRSTKPAAFPSADFDSTTITDVPQSEVWENVKDLRSNGYTLFSFTFEDDGQITIRAVGGLNAP